MRIVKSIVCIILSLSLLAGGAAVAYASDSYLALYGFSFTVNDNGEAVIREYDGRSAEVAIPNALLNARVVRIDNYALTYARENGIRYFITNNDYYLGDADCDENVTVSDVTAIQQELAGFDLPVFNDRAANVDGGDLDISDALKIQRYVARFDDQLGIGSLIKVGSDEYESELIP